MQEPSGILKSTWAGISLCVKICLRINHSRNLTCHPTSTQVLTFSDFLNSIKGIFKVKPTFPTFGEQKLGGFVVIAFKASLSQNTFLRHRYHSCSLSLEAKTSEECVQEMDKRKICFTATQKKHQTKSQNDEYAQSLSNYRSATLTQSGD